MVGRINRVGKGLAMHGSKSCLSEEGVERGRRFLQNNEINKWGRCPLSSAGTTNNRLVNIIRPGPQVVCPNNSACFSSWFLRAAQETLLSRQVFHFAYETLLSPLPRIQPFPSAGPFGWTDIPRHDDPGDRVLCRQSRDRPCSCHERRGHVFRGPRLDTGRSHGTPLSSIQHVGRPFGFYYRI